MTQLRPSAAPWVVIPTYNEAGNIANAVKRIRKALPAANVLVVDDSSPDGTAHIVEALGADDPMVSVVVRPAKSGLGSAYRDGFPKGMAEGATALIEMDADLSHEPEALPELVAALDSGADLAIGSRYVPGGASPGLTAGRLALSRGGNIYAKFALGLPVMDATSGFRAYRPSLLGAINLSTVSADGYGFQIEMVFRATLLGARIKEVPIIFNQRVEGVSKMSTDIVREAMLLCTVWAAQRRVRQLLGKSSDFIPYHKADGSMAVAVLHSLRS